MTSFLSEFLRNPLQTAAIAPSSQALAAAMLADIDFATLSTVVEYGPGTGVFTRAVLQRLRDAGNNTASFTALELNPRLASILQHEAAGVDVRIADARTIDSEVDAARESRVDLIVSGLGWPSIPADPRRDILRKTAAALRPGGEFRTFGYHIGLLMPGAWDFRARVRELFSEVIISPVIWNNLPPAFVYRCRR